MTSIYKRLSSKESNGLSEVLLRVRNAKDYDINAKSGIFVTKDNFKNGEIVVNRRKMGNDVIYHEEQEKKMANLCATILNAVAGADKAEITPKWLRTVIDKFNNPEKYVKAAAPKADIYTLMLEWCDKSGVCEARARGNHSLMRIIASYVAFVNATDKKRKKFDFNVDHVTREDIEDFFDYVKNEKELSEEYPRLFKKLNELCPEGVCKGISLIKARGTNYVAWLEKRLRAFFNWLYKERITTNRPFEGLSLQRESYGTPYYISIEERNQIADYDFSNDKRLETQRDIFIFQCFVGCRVGDLMSFTEGNITNGMLVYTPHKTKNKGETPIQARVPLHAKALELIEKYKGADRKGHLFPFTSGQKYNVAIKEIFTAAGITRNVEVRNPITGKNEIRPLNEIASSHLARRTFIGNAYFKVSDPNIIGKMSGHAEGSKAFARYRRIEDETLQSVISLIG